MKSAHLPEKILKQDAGRIYILVSTSWTPDWRSVHSGHFIKDVFTAMEDRRALKELFDGKIERWTQSITFSDLFTRHGRSFIRFVRSVIKYSGICDEKTDRFLQNEYTIKNPRCFPESSYNSFHSPSYDKFSIHVKQYGSKTDEALLEFEN